MTYIGIDPGKKGAFATIKTDFGGILVDVYPWEEELFIYEMRRAYKFLSDNTVACLEHVGPMPKQGVTSTFHFGENFGFIQGVLTAYGIPFELVRPQKWKKEFSITGDKNTSIDVCKRLFPDVSLKRTEKCKKDNDGMAEALLMADYARRKFGR